MVYLGLIGFYLAAVLFSGSASYGRKTRQGFKGYFIFRI
jgi:hypothetical protein